MEEKMKMKKRVISLALAALLLLVFAGCKSSGKPTTSPDPSSPPPASSAPTESSGPVEPGVEMIDYTAPVQLIVAAKPGATSDLSCRLFAQCFSRVIGQEVVVVNVAGGGGSPAMHQVDDAAADGYTMFWLEENNLTNTAIGACDMAWSDMDLVATVGGTGTTCFLASGTTGIDGVASMKEYYEKNGPISMAITYGMPSHFMTTAIERATGVELRNVDVDTGSDKILAVVSGQLQMTQLAVDQFEQYVADGTMNIIGNVGAERNQFIPDVKTFKEQGADIGDFYKFWGILLKKGTDEKIIASTNAWIEKCMADPRTLEDYANMRYDVHYRSTEEAIEYVSSKEDFYNEIAEYILSTQAK
jgi:tripartite-type tricarboxylate transporter receptor subunit TctC